MGGEGGEGAYTVVLCVYMGVFVKAKYVLCGCSPTRSSGQRRAAASGDQ